MNKSLLHILFLLTLFTAGCNGNKTDNNSSVIADSDIILDSSTVVTPEYAKGFKVTYLDDIKLIDISDPEQKNASEFHIALVGRGSATEVPEGYIRVETPIKSAVCMTSLQLSNFIKLGLTDIVTGVTSTRHLFNTEMNERIRSGKTAKIGIEGNFDREVLMAINPDLILISPFKRGGYDALKEVETPLVPHLGYKEITPLGQAEWIKFIGLLTGHEKEANKIFDEIAARYNHYKSLVDTVSYRPMVMSGEMRGGNWYAVGGESFLSHIFRDAGATYFLHDNKESGGVTLDYETIYTHGANAPYWRIVNSYDGEFSYDVLKSSDERYTDFSAYKNHGVIYCNMKTVPFYERMPVEPDEVLADFIAIFHPGILKDHKPSYYQLLK